MLRVVRLPRRRRRGPSEPTRAAPPRGPSRSRPATGEARASRSPSAACFVLADDHSTMRPNFQRASRLNGITRDERVSCPVRLAVFADSTFPAGRPLHRGSAGRADRFGVWLVSTDPIIPPPGGTSIIHREIPPFRLIDFASTQSVQTSYEFYEFRPRRCDGGGPLGRIPPRARRGSSFVG